MPLLYDIYIFTLILNTIKIKRAGLCHCPGSGGWGVYRLCQRHGHRPLSDPGHDHHHLHPGVFKGHCPDPYAQLRGKGESGLCEGDKDQGGYFFRGFSAGCSHLCVSLAGPALHQVWAQDLRGGQWGALCGAVGH